MTEDSVFSSLDHEEKDLIESVEKDEWVEVADAEEYRKQGIEYAQTTTMKDRRMNTRISERNLKRKVLKEGIPCQTIVVPIAAVVSGRPIRGAAFLLIGERTRRFTEQGNAVHHRDRAVGLASLAHSLSHRRMAMSSRRFSRKDAL